MATPDKEAALAADIRLLGRILGDTLRQFEGEATFESRSIMARDFGPGRSILICGFLMLRAARGVAFIEGSSRVLGAPRPSGTPVREAR